MTTRELEPISIEDADDAASVLVGLRTECRKADLAESRKLQCAATWAAMHSVESITPVAWDVATQGWVKHDIPLAGPGAPAVAEFCVAEFAAAMGLSTDSGRLSLGEAVELRYRLPRLWHRVVACDLPAWKARRVAKGTVRLFREGAAFVDGTSRLWRTRSGCRLEAHHEAMVRFDPDTAEAGGSRLSTPATSTFMPIRSATTAPWPSTGSSTWPTPWTSTPS